MYILSQSLRCLYKNKTLRENCSVEIQWMSDQEKTGRNPIHGKDFPNKERVLSMTTRMAKTQRYRPHTLDTWYFAVKSSRAGHLSDSDAIQRSHWWSPAQNESFHVTANSIGVLFRFFLKHSFDKEKTVKKRPDTPNSCDTPKNGRKMWSWCQIRPVCALSEKRRTCFPNIRSWWEIGAYPSQCNERFDSCLSFDRYEDWIAQRRRCLYRPNRPADADTPAVDSNRKMNPIDGGLTRHQ